MNISSILYVSEEAWGFGPGANETGIIVYKMPEVVAHELETSGLAYLQALPKNPGRGWQGRYSQWRLTPVVNDGRWPSARERGDWVSPGIGDYIFKYVYTPLDAEVEQMVNEAIFSGGSYYAYGRIGMIILIPHTRRIVYAYNG